MQAAFLGSKSVESVIQQLRIRIAAVNAWTDSIIVWYWLQKPSHYWKTWPWVANRVSFIHETSTSCNITWRHCPGSMNRADLPSRRATIQELRKVDWLHAPKRTTDVNQWPPLCIGPAEDEVSESARPAYVAVSSVLIENTWWTRMSTWTRILGTAAYMLKWKYKEQDICQHCGEWQKLSCSRLFKRLSFQRRLISCGEANPCRILPSFTGLRPFYMRMVYFASEAGGGWPSGTLTDGIQFCWVSIT